MIIVEESNDETKELNQYHNIDIFEYVSDLKKNIGQDKKERR